MVTEMLDPLSIASGAANVAHVCRTLTQGFSRFVGDVKKDEPAAVSDIYNTLKSLEKSLLALSEQLRQRPHQLPFEHEHHGSIYDIVCSCLRALDRLATELPDLNTGAATSGRAFDKARIRLVSTLGTNSVRQLAAHINLYIQVLQLSLVTLSLGTMWAAQSSQKEIQEKIRQLTAAMPPLHPKRLSIHLDSQVTDLQDHIAEANILVTNEIQAWRLSAETVCAAVALHDPDQALLEAMSGASISASTSEGPSSSRGGFGGLRPVSGSVIPSDSGVDLEFDRAQDDFFQDPEPAHRDRDYPGPDILQVQFEQNQKMVQQLVSCGIFLQASAYQRKGIEFRTILAQMYGVPLPWDEEAEMRESLADILLSSDNKDATREACEILDALLNDEVKRKGQELDQPRRCRLYHKLGALYMQQPGKLRVARTYLSRAFNGRREMEPMPTDLVLESGDLLVRVLQLDQDFDSARGYMQWMRRELRPDPRTRVSSCDDAELSNAFLWCKGRGFDVEADNFRFEAIHPTRGTSPLHLAVREENIEIVRPMVEYGGDFEQRDSDGLTPLLIACGTRNWGVVQILLDRGARVEVCDRRGMTGLHRCQAKDGGVKVAKLLVQWCNMQPTQFSSGSSTASSSTGPSLPPPPPTATSALVRVDVINAVDSSGKTALYMAVENGNEKMVSFLLKAHAHPDVTDNYGKTALYMACERGNERMVSRLLEHKANPNIRGPGSCTPLVATLETVQGIAIKMTLTRLLLAHGADPSIPDADGWTAFQVAKKSSFSSQLTRVLQEAAATAAAASSASASAFAPVSSSSGLLMPPQQSYQTPPSHRHRESDATVAPPYLMQSVEPDPSGSSSRLSESRSRKGSIKESSSSKDGSRDASKQSSKDKGKEKATTVDRGKEKDKDTDKEKRSRWIRR